MLPVRTWLNGYHSVHAKSDLMAGVTTAIMLVPQSMAYAVLAGLPAYVGLYASILPPVVYAVLGTSRPLAVGPVAMDSLLTAGAVGAIAASGSDSYLILSAALAIMVGGVHLLAGFLRLGKGVRLLSRPVVSGFVAAAALIIGLNQLKLILGVPLPRTIYLHEIFMALWGQLGHISWVTLAIGLSSIAILVGLKRWRPHFPRALLVVVASTLLVVGLALDVNQIGHVPRGLPTPGLPQVTVSELVSLLPSAIVIALVAMMEAISVSQKLKGPSDPEIKPNQELIALGAANVAAGLSQGFPVTGGFSRTAVANSAGAVTPLYGVVTGVLLGLTVVLLGPLLEPIPKAVLGAIIMTAVFGLIDLREPFNLFRQDRVDFVIYAVTLLATLSLGIQQGVAVGVVLGLLLSLRFKKLAMEKECTPEGLHLHLTGDVHFLNVERLCDEIKQCGGPVKIDGERRLDSTAHAQLDLALGHR